MGELDPAEHDSPLTRTHAQNELELLDPGTEMACAPWGAELPERLRELHSHWLWR